LTTTFSATEEEEEEGRAMSTALAEVEPPKGGAFSLHFIVILFFHVLQMHLDSLCPWVVGGSGAGPHRRAEEDQGRLPPLRHRSLRRLRVSPSSFSLHFFAFSLIYLFNTFYLLH
jgi:hypothetical protein